MEIISGVERRRQWRVEDKLCIVAEAERPGACFVEVARKRELRPKLGDGGLRKAAYRGG